MKRTQSGMTLIGFVIVLAVVGLFAYVGMKRCTVCGGHFPSAFNSVMAAL